MPDRHPRAGPGPPRPHVKSLVLVMAMALLATLIGAVTPTAASAAGGTTIFLNSFANNTVDGTGTLTKPTASTGGTNVVCLSASGNALTPPLLSCPSTPDAPGSGKLRLTGPLPGQVGGVFGATSFPSSNGLDVTFNAYQYGGGQGGEGIAFALAAVDPANPLPPTSIGSAGAGLGYSGSSSVSGLANAYLGLGLDVLGNFSTTAANGTGCTNPTTIAGVVPGAVVARGPGSGRVGYCGLTTTSDGTAASQLALRAPTRANSAMPVQVLINPTSSTYTSGSGAVVSPGTYKVVVTPNKSVARTLTGPLPTAPSTLYPSTTWLGAGGVPKQLAFGFVGSTGTKEDLHEVSDVEVQTFTPVPRLAITNTSYSIAAPGPGQPVNYVLTPSVQPGATETSPISVVETLPSGVLPVGAYGTGWACGSPVGQTIACTTTGSSFPGGTTLPVINVVAIVNGTGVTSAIIQSSSTTRISSGDGNPAVLTTATAGTVPTAPAGVAVNPLIGPTAGGGVVTITGTNLTGATAIEIGTAAEQQAGTPVVLLPCPGAAAAGCFTVSGSTLVISSMPPRAGLVGLTITVATLGVAGSAGYTYANRPSAPTTPSATAGLSRATVTWAAPAANGSPLTGYVVTSYRGGVAQAPLSFDASSTARTLTGLTAGASYTFTVAAVNAVGTGTASVPSAAVIPYNVPDAPSALTARAGNNSATVGWSTPSANGSAISGYLVTIYVGGVVQSTRTFNSTATAQAVTGLTAGTAYTFTVAAVNGIGTGPASASSAAVTPNLSPSLTFAAPPPGQVNVAYSTQLPVNDGTAPFAWSVSAGTLPAGLTLSAGGLLSGTPTGSGSFPVTVQVADASGETATRSVTLVIAAAPAMTFSPAAGEITVPYSQQPTLTGGTRPVTWAITAGGLPAGLTISASTGLISGTPTASGSFSVTVSATDSFSQVASRTVAIVIAALPTITSSAPLAGQAGLTYSTTFTVAGGSTPLVWSISAGSAPPGLALSSTTGVLSGTPTTTGSWSFTVQLTDAFGKTTTKAVTLVVNAGPLVITKTADVSSVSAGGTVTYTLEITNTSSTSFPGVNLSDPLSGVLDDAVYRGNASASTGSLSYAASTLGWTGTVAGGATVTITYSVTTAYPVRGDQTLRNQVSSTSAGASCAAGSTDPACRSLVSVLRPALTITKTADRSRVVAGGKVTYTLRAANTGETDYPTASLTDSLADVLDDAGYDANASASSGTVSYAAGTLSWTGGLARGENVLITYSVTTSSAGSGNATLVNEVSSTTVGSTCGGAGAAPCRSTVAVQARAITLTGLTPSFTLTAVPGSTVTKENAVQMTVTTNSTGGYTVTVQGGDESLTGARDGNPDSIPLSRLHVKDSSQSSYTPLSAVDAFLVHAKTGPSGPIGDAVSNDYEVDLPFVASDTYSTTLEYIVAAQ